MRRRRTKHRDLPPLMHRKQGRYYYGRNQIALGDSLPAALRRYAEIHGSIVAGAEATFSDASREYLRKELHNKRPVTQREYRRQLAKLIAVFGRMPLASIRPGDIRRYMQLRGGTVAATREKALFSAVFNFARSIDLTNAPNPCAGIKGRGSKRDRYVEDSELASVYAVASQTVRDFLDLAYLTGQRPSDILKMKRADVKNGALWVQQSKTGTKVRIAIAGPLEDVLARLTARPVASLRLVADERGQPLTLGAIRKRFVADCAKAGVSFQLRDVRAKAGTDLEDAHKANALLGHAAMTTTDVYLRRRAGERVGTLTRGIVDKASGIADKATGIADKSADQS
jgi:integrase